MYYFMIGRRSDCALTADRSAGAFMKKPQDSKYQVPPVDPLYQDRWRRLRCMVLAAGGTIPLGMIIIGIMSLGSLIGRSSTRGSHVQPGEIALIAALLPAIYLARLNLMALRFNLKAWRAATWDSIAAANTSAERFWKALALALVAGLAIGCCWLIVWFFTSLSKMSLF
jgi:hypothetical protein